MHLSLVNCASKSGKRIGLSGQADFIPPTSVIDLRTMAGSKPETGNTKDDDSKAQSAVTDLMAT